MPVMMMFRLKPVAEALAHPAWAASHYCGSCLVLAEDAERARCYASGAFTLPVWDHEGSAPSHPWRIPALVAAEAVAGCPACGLREAGQLMLEDAAGLRPWIGSDAPASAAAGQGTR